MKKSFRRLLSLTLAVLMILVTATACSGNGENGGNAGNGGGSNYADRTVLNLQIPVNPAIIIPSHSTQQQEFQLTYQIFDNLVDINKGNWDDLIPGLAESWDISEDGLQYTFHLRTGVKFHNGNDFDSEDVAYTLQMIKDSKTTSNKVFMIDSWETPDANTIIVKLNQPYATFLGLLASNAFGIVCKEAIEEFGDLEGGVVGTGAYKLEKWNPGESIVMTANEDYYRGAPKIKTINFKVMSDNNTAFIAFKNGELDEFLYGSSFDIDSVKNNPDIKIESISRTSCDQLVFNTKNPALSNILVRKAINHAIDRDAVNIAIYDGLAIPTELNIPQSHPGWTDKFEKYDYNVDKAKSLLKEAGYNAGDITLTLTYPTTTIGTKFATAIQASLQAVGINCETEGLEAAAWTQKVISREYDIAYFAYGSTPYNPPNSFNALHVSDGNWNLSNFKGPEATEIDNILRAAYKDTNVDTQTKAYEEAMAKYHDLALEAPVIIAATNVMHNSHLKGTNYEEVVMLSKYYQYSWE